MKKILEKIIVFFIVLAGLTFAMGTILAFASSDAEPVIQEQAPVETITVTPTPTAALTPTTAARKKITGVSVTGLTPAGYGKKLDMRVKMSGTGYTVDEVYWTEGGSSAKLSKNYISKENTKYTAYIVLKAKEGYAFDTEILEKSTYRKNDAAIIDGTGSYIVKSTKASITIARAWMTGKASLAITSVKNTAPETATVKIRSSSMVESYQIQYSTNKKFNNAKKITSQATTVKLTDLKKGKTYYVRVRACKMLGGTAYYSPWSDAKTVFIAKEWNTGEETLAVSSVKNTAPGTATVKITGSSQVTGYQVQYSANKKFTNAKKKTVKKKKIKLTSLKKGKTYYVRVRACKKVGNVKYYSLWSNIRSVKIIK